VDSQKAIEEFSFKFCGFLLEEGATYSSIILTKHNSVLYSYSTNRKWDHIYHETGYSKSCHLMGATKSLVGQHDNFTLFWDALPPSNEISSYLNEKRNENNICHGVSFCNKNSNGVLEILTIAGRKCDLHFSSQIIDSKEMIQKNLLGFKRKYK
jgi:hypothetical protein